MSDNTAFEPLNSEPLNSEPLNSEPLNSEPLNSEPLNSEPLNSEPLNFETINYVTRNALTVNPALLGLPLAKPWKRIVAIALDGIAVALLNTITPIFLVIGLSSIFYKMSGTGDQEIGFWGEKTHSLVAILLRKCLRFIAACTLVVACIVLVLDVIGYATTPEIPKKMLSETAVNIHDDADKTSGKKEQAENEKHDNERLDNEKQNKKLAEIEAGSKESKEALLAAYDLVFATHMCNAVSCYKGVMKSLGRTLKKTEMSDEDILATLKQYAAKTQLSDKEQEQLVNTFYSLAEDGENADDEEEKEQNKYSIISIVQQFMADLGVGVGWAAMYFTLCISMMRGQTLGKKLLGIRVVQLDNTNISLWEAFGRYGGYTAGVATGLLGFLQIFWDPNRQAVQDKIAATLVIDLYAKPFVASSNSAEA